MNVPVARTIISFEVAFILRYLPRRLPDDPNNISTQGSVDLFKIMETREDCSATVIGSEFELAEQYLCIEGELMINPVLNCIATGALCIYRENSNIRECFLRRREVRGDTRNSLLAPGGIYCGLVQALTEPCCVERRKHGCCVGRVRIRRCVLLSPDAMTQVM